MRNDPFDPFGQEMPEKRKKPARRSGALILILPVLAVIGVLTVAGTRMIRTDTGRKQQASSMTQADTGGLQSQKQTGSAQAETGTMHAQQQTGAEEDSISQIPHFEDRFFLRNISQELQRDTAAIYQGIASFEKEIELPDAADSDSIERIMAVLRYDCPELFQASFERGFQLKSYNGAVHSVILSYGMEKEEYDRKLAQCREAIAQLVRDAKEYAGQSREAGTGSGSQEAAERYLYDTLTDGITYSMDAPGCGNACGALVGHAAKCDGISLAMKWVMEELGIPALVIAGHDQSDPDGHAWNCLQIDGVWYDLDLTNDSMAPDRIMKLYPAYNVRREWMTRMYPLDPVIASFADLPAAETMDRSYHVLDGSFVPAGEDIKSAFFALLDAAAAENGGDADPGTGIGRIQFEDDDDFSMFMDNYDTYVTDWFRQRNLGGGFNINSIAGFRTCGIVLTVD